MASTWMDDVEKEIATSLAKMAKDGSVPAASAVLKLLDQKREAAASEAHRAKMASLEDTPIELCRYLGELGQSADDTEKHLGRGLTMDERAALAHGNRSRLIEVRAIELAAARQSGKIADWMNQ